MPLVLPYALIVLPLLLWLGFQTAWLGWATLITAGAAILITAIQAAAGWILDRVDIEVDLPRQLLTLRNVRFEHGLRRSPRGTVVLRPGDIEKVTLNRYPREVSTSLNILTTRGQVILISSRYGTFAELHRLLSLLYLHAHCFKCGHNLTGINSDLCPECGAARAARID
jgi:hypothetical protein